MAAGGLCLACVTAGCITEVIEKDPKFRPVGTTIKASPEDTTEAKTAKCRAWVAELAMEDVPQESQGRRTIFIVKQLVEHIPFSTGPILETGVTHASSKVRENCAFVLCYATEARAEEALLKLLDDGAESVRLSAAASLIVGYDNRAGVPPLLRALYSSNAHFRAEAIKNLKIYTGQYYGYHPLAPVEEREFAAAKYHEWWRENRDTFVPPERGLPRARPK